MNELLDELGLENTDQLFVQIGLGERLAPFITKVFLQTADSAGERTGQHEPVIIAGTESLVVSYGRCCHPIPGDDVMGYLSAGRGVIVHRNVCGNLSEFRKQPDKWIGVNWEQNIIREFSVEIMVEVTNRPGVLAEVAASIGDSGSNINQVSVDDRHEGIADLAFLILVKDRTHLANVIRAIRRMAVVKRITRTCT